MRTRALKPGFFKNEALAECPPLCRILFEGLWLMADREGRLEDRPTRIKAEILPYDKCKVDVYLEMLNRLGFISRYEAQGQKCIQITNFRKHQNPHVKEPASTVPAPYLHSASTGNSDTCTGLAPDKNSSDPAVNPYPVNPLLFPVNPDPVNGGPGSETDLSELWGGGPEDQLSGAEANAYHAGFDAFMRRMAELRDGNVGDVEEAWAVFRLRVPPDQVGRLLEHVEHYAASSEVKRGRVMKAAKFLSEWPQWDKPRVDKPPPAGKSAEPWMGYRGYQSGEMSQEEIDRINAEVAAMQQEQAS